MGASESAPRKEEEKEEDNGGGSGEFIAKAAVAAATVGVAAWGISKMLSDNSESQEKEEEMKMKMKAPASYLLNSRKYRELESEDKYGSSSSVRRRFKMNTDATYRRLQGSGAYAGILRDDRGKWVRGFRGFIEVSDVLEAEINGIHKGLRLLKKLHVVESTLESDCKAAVDWINNQNKDRATTPNVEVCWEMIKECRQIKEENRIIVASCGRDANKCADKLAAMAFKNGVDYEEIRDLPDEIKELVEGDATY